MMSNKKDKMIKKSDYSFRNGNATMTDLLFQMFRRNDFHCHNGPLGGTLKLWAYSF